MKIVKCAVDGLQKEIELVRRRILRKARSYEKKADSAHSRYDEETYLDYNGVANGLREAAKLVREGLRKYS